ncbi:sigma-54 factor, interaction region [gamma proteobacterium NOR5-3]|nr:sigma-54 factor, interaction region [gamma proteobacterium NOR5-3]
MTDKTTLLIVDDDEDVLTAARLLLRQYFGRVITQTDPGMIPDLIASESIDVFLLDMNFAIGRNSGKEGLHWLGEIRQRDPAAVVVLMTAYGDLNTAVAAMRDGATDFVLKPWQNDRLVATLRVAANLRHTRAQLSALTTPPPGGTMIAGAPSIQRVMKVVKRVASTDATVLVRGENGTGKELIAQELHRLSPRSTAPMVSVDLGALAENLFESELFGHRRGAFTGAESDRAGRFQAASGGTLFLDEIGNLPLSLQTKLLRALENREVTPLGMDSSIDVDIRLIAATNQPLEDMVARGEFREDLLYRINTISIELPPLRERLEDLPELAHYFAVQAARRYRLPVKEISANALQALRQWGWPGNVRELSHAIERAVIMSESDTLVPQDFDLTPRQLDDLTANFNLEDNERRLVQTALQRYEGNVSRAAEALGITRAALYRRMEKFGL